MDILKESDIDEYLKTHGIPDEILQLKPRKEFDEAFNIFRTKIQGESKGEVIFVQKTDGSIIMTPRRNTDNIFHPHLVSGEDVAAAGTIIPLDQELIMVTNLGGHYKIPASVMGTVLFYLKLFGYKIVYRPVGKPNDT